MSKSTLINILSYIIFNLIIISECFLSFCLIFILPVPFKTVWQSTFLNLAGNNRYKSA